ncbi:MAG: condensation domain-containing protein, partial [Oscillospiraceae bacterium]
MNKFRLSEPQKLIYNSVKVHGDDVATLKFFGKLVEKIEYSRYDSAVNELICNSETLRIRIGHEVDETPYQYIEKYEYKKQDYTEVKTKKDFEILKSDFYKSNVSFEKELYKFNLVKFEDEFYAMASFNHICVDGYSLSLITNLLWDRYFKGIEIQKTTYTNYIEAEDKYFESSRYEKDKEYYDLEIKEENVNLINTKNITNFTREKISIALDYDFMASVNKYIKEKNISLVQLVIAAASVYLKKHLNISSVYIGTPLLNRIDRNERKSLGMNANMLPILVEQGKSKEEFFGRIKRNLLKAIRTQRYSYNDILNKFRQKNGPQSQIFDFCVNYLKVDKIDKYYSEFEWRQAKKQTMAMEIVINDLKENGNVLLDFNYLEQAFSKEDIEYMGKHIIYILKQIIEMRDDENIDSVEICDSESEKAIEGFNETFKEYNNNRTLVEIFEDTVKKHPDNIAVEHKDESITYREL